MSDTILNVIIAVTWIILTAVCSVEIVIWIINQGVE